jgi:hypothetical protein
VAAAPAPLPRESTFQDDHLLIYNSSAGVARTLSGLKSLGVDRIRVSVFWNLVAPAPKSRRRPRFDAGNPAAYPAGGWYPYDRLVTFAAQRGIGVNFDLTDPAPLWATARGAPRPDVAPTWHPAVPEFAAFVKAAGTRYSGSYLAPVPTTSASQPRRIAALPRVSYWSIWNEPDQGGWLTPQWVARGRKQIEYSPLLYRRLLDAAYASLLATGHGGDTILIGETAPKGLNVKGPTRAMKPLRFIRQLYCLGSNYRPLRGAAAAERGCPTTAAATAHFAAAHPALFSATGWAHHPYELTFAPNVAPRDREFVTIADLGNLTVLLQRVRSAYGHPRPGGMPLYLTEFGYQSNPPSPLGVSLAQQAAYLNESEFIAYTNPNVRTLSQFLLQDSPPAAGGSFVASIGGTFQTGLEFRGGRHKPAFDAYRFPVYLPSPSIARGHTLLVWGLVRLAAYGTSQNVQIQWRRKRGTYRTIATVADDGARGYVYVRIRVPGTGQIRLAWTRPGTSQTVYSRSVGERVR